MTAPDLESRRAWLDLRQAMRCRDREAWDADYQGLMGERVAQTRSPSMAVTVNTPGHGRATLILPVADPIHPRIDTVCERGGHVQVVQGIPAAQPVPPRCPVGYGALAHVRVMANATSVTAANIEGAPA